MPAIGNNAMPAEPFFADTDADLVDWNRLLLSSPAGSFVISSNWFSSLATYGFEAKYLLTRDAAGTLTGGAALAVFRMGSFSWIDVPHGPALRKKDDAALHALLQAIENYAERIRAAFVQISPFEPMPYEERWEREAAKHKLPYDPGLPRGANMGVGAALLARGFYRGGTHTVLPVGRYGQLVSLENGVPLEGFRQNTRRDIKLSLQNPAVSVQMAEDMEALRLSYSLLVENAVRAGYALRPWSSFVQAVWEGVRNGTVLVMNAAYDGKPEGTIVVGLGGRRGSYAMGATSRDRHPHAYLGALLQYRAMEHLATRGFEAYDLTAIMGGGVQDFKRGFRPTYYRLAGDLVKIYRPRLYRAYRFVYPFLRRHRRALARAWHAVFAPEPQ
ncbi:MAG: GNAT family N-acetyltransferase [Lentisphaerae bacterium]|jgi:hypothetical protein|nr:GNAT family N-acetyltransferase [Lentisphaerota bacterium]